MATDGKEDENMYQNEAIGYSLVSIPPSNLDQNPEKNAFLTMFLNDFVSAWIFWVTEQICLYTASLCYN